MLLDLDTPQAHNCRPVQAPDVGAQDLLHCSSHSTGCSLVTLPPKQASIADTCTSPVLNNLVCIQYVLVAMQFVLVLSTYRASPQWLQHPSNTAHALCGSNQGLAQAAGYLWWPETNSNELSFCVVVCPPVGLSSICETAYCMRVCLLLSCHVHDTLQVYMQKA